MAFNSDDYAFLGDLSQNCKKHCRVRSNLTNIICLRWKGEPETALRCTCMAYLSVTRVKCSIFCVFFEPKTMIVESFLNRERVLNGSKSPVHSPALSTLVEIGAIV